MPQIDLGQIIGPPGPPGSDGQPGKDATINGVNTLEIIEGDNITIEQDSSTLRISATGGGGPVTREVVVNAPIGAILPWSGGADTVPDGWHICDGENGTVDLRDRFILGAGDNHKHGETSGSETVRLELNQIPNHSHAIGVRYGSSAKVNDTSGTYLLQGTLGTGYSMQSYNAGGNAPHENMPPYLALYYIQKISETPTDYVTEERAQEIAQQAILLGTPSASQVSFDNETSGLLVDNVQDAIDELSHSLGAIGKCPDFSNLVTMVQATATLSFATWSNDNTQTIVIDGLSEETVQLVLIIPSDKSKNICAKCGVGYKSINSNIITINANTIPNEDVQLDVFMFGAAKLTETQPNFVWYSPKMTSDNSPSPYRVVAQSVGNANSPAWAAFDGIPQTDAYSDTGRSWMSAVGAGEDKYVQIDFGERFFVRSFKINPRYSRPSGTNILSTPNRLYIAGSNNGEDWFDIASYDDIKWAMIGEYTEFPIDKNALYRYYRFGVRNVLESESYGGRVGFGDIQFYIREGTI